MSDKIGDDSNEFKDLIKNYMEVISKKKDIQEIQKKYNKEFKILEEKIFKKMNDKNINNLLINNNTKLSIVDSKIRQNLKKENIIEKIQKSVVSQKINLKHDVCENIAENILNNDYIIKKKIKLTKK